MHTSPEHRLRRIGSHHMIVGAGDASHANVYVLNDTAAYLWRSVEGTEFDAAALASLLTAAYDVDPARALADARAMADEWLRLGLARE